MKNLLAVIAFGILAIANAGAAPTVVLLHGLARTADSMSRMEERLAEAGYATCNIDYPSTRYTIQTLAKEHVLPAIRQCLGGKAGRVHFVTHSMGGILVREIRRVAPDVPIGRVVMLGPPNHGSELVDHLRSWALFQWVNGPAGQQLGTEPASVPNSLGPADFELGVIAGNKPLLEPFKGYIRGPSDGKVSIESARLEGMTGYVLLPVTHALMMRDDQVIRQTLAFLESGAFSGARSPDHARQPDRPGSPRDQSPPLSTRN